MARECSEELLSLTEQNVRTCIQIDNLVVGRPEPSHKLASRLFVACYWILTITLVAIYNGNLIAFMTVRTQQLPINTLQELASHPEYQAGVMKGSVYSDLFKVSFFPLVFFFEI